MKFLLNTIAWILIIICILFFVSFDRARENNIGVLGYWKKILLDGDWSVIPVKAEEE